MKAKMFCSLSPPPIVRICHTYILYIHNNTDTTIKYMYIIYTTTDHHHTVHVARLHKCSISAIGWMIKHHQRKLLRMNYHVYKWTICASECRKKHHQCKLQLVTTTTNWNVCTIYIKEGKHHKHKVQRAGCKVQKSGPASALVGTAQHATTTTTTIDHIGPDRTSSTMQIVRCSNQWNFHEDPLLPL